MHIIVMSLTVDGARDAPLIVPFISMPTFDRLCSGIKAIDREAPIEKIAELLTKAGVSDNTLTQTMVMLASARSAGEWPSIENRLEDGSLLCFQLLTVMEASDMKRDRFAKFRRPKRN